VIVLASDELLARVDPRHGAEILDLVDLRTGRQLLGRPPFSSAIPRGGDLEEEAWTESYRGGWQLVAPNAGKACDLDGERHGFHGRASNDPWTVVEAGAANALLRWEGHGLSIDRRLSVKGAALGLEVEATATRDGAALVVLEHVSVGLELLHPEVELELPAGRAYELSESEGPTAPPEAAPHWPDVLLRDGSVERTVRWPAEQTRDRLYAIADLPEGRAVVRNAHSGAALRLSWDHEWLRHMWVWHDVRSLGGIWRGRSEILTVEPTSVPHSLGLAEAVEQGYAPRLALGESRSYRLEARAEAGS
jgi:hypothetical protein